MRRILFCSLLLILAGNLLAQDKEVTIKLFHTSDIHGNFFPFDFINNRDNRGSLARVSTYMNAQRATYGDNTLLLEGGDMLQGQPCVYYYNFVDTVSAHLGAQVLNYLNYDAGVMGNHDIETGHSVYTRWVEDCDFPVLGANILTREGEPYLPPYCIVEKEGVKIAVIGMITQAIPAWLPENLWKGLQFTGIEETSRKLIPIIKETEQPDIIVGLFHSGVKTSEVAGFKESVGMDVAKRVPGFDIILCGHDHALFCEKIASQTGDSVLVVNPASRADYISNVTICAEIRDGKVTAKHISGELDNIATIEPDKAYMDHFAEAYTITRNYVDEEIGEFTHTISSRDAFFGPSSFVDLLHQLQFKITGADISLVAPLSQNAQINAGKIYMRDMFNLYRYENLLYVMTLTGEEVRKSLEYCYGLWYNQMTSPEDPLLLISTNQYTGRRYFTNPFFAFNSAAGILYTVDVTKPVGERVHITSMSDGMPFEESKTYRVAVNSYQGSGGAGILTDGSGIARERLHERVIYSTEKDLRFYLAEEIENQKVVSPQPLNEWKVLPADWVEEAGKRDYELMFGKTPRE